MDTSASGCVQYLKTLTDVTALVGAFDANDPVAANAGQPWIFHVANSPGSAGMQDSDVLRVMEGTSQAAITCSYEGGWSGGTPGWSAQFERLAVTFWVDVARDSSRNLTETSGGTLRRAMALYYTVDSHLHRREVGDNVAWGDVVTVGACRLTHPDFYAVPDGDGLMRGVAYYGVTISGHLGAVV